MPKYKDPQFIGKTPEESEVRWPEVPCASKDRPNVLVVLLDDVGFGHLGCYGGSIATPNIDRLAKNGIQFTRFHTTALCSPTRASLLTGRNHHSNGMASIPQLSSAFPGHNAYMPPENGTLAEVLKESGYSTMAVGKWHLAPDTETHPAGPFDRWPLARGFERFYGFLMGMIDHWNPGMLTEDNHFVSVPGGNGYHLTDDLTDTAIRYIREAYAVNPDKPFFMYLAYGAGHSPHQVDTAYSDRYRGAFDHGWDEERERILQRQKELGIMPDYVKLPPRNADVPAWKDLSDDQKRVMARFQEVFAGFLTHCDENIGSVIEALTELGKLENTLVVFLSDNGASREGGPNGHLNEYAFYNGLEETIDDHLERFDEIGGPGMMNNYPMGWSMAGNTPFRDWKRYTYQGGIADPLIVHCPDKIKQNGLRDQYHHVIDVMPMILEATGAELPKEIKGVQQSDMHGVSMWYAASDPDSPTRKKIQYYEMLGGRAIYYDGWKAVSTHVSMSDTGNFQDDVWELFYLPDDPNETNNLAAKHPDKLRDLIDRWWIEAGRYNVLPLDDRGYVRWADPRPKLRNEARYTFFPGSKPIFERAAPDILNRSFEISARLAEANDGATEGVILCQGNRYGGYSFYILDGLLCFTYNLCGVKEFHAKARIDLSGTTLVRARFASHGNHSGVLTLLLGNESLKTCDIPQTISRILPIHGSLSCGADNGGLSVTPRYAAPFPFTGKISSVDFFLGPQGPVDVGKVFEAMISEQ